MTMAEELEVNGEILEDYISELAEEVRWPRRAANRDIALAILPLFWRALTAWNNQAPQIARRLVIEACDLVNQIAAERGLKLARP